jgi:hypothetical protein
MVVLTSAWPSSSCTVRRKLPVLDEIDDTHPGLILAAEHLQDCVIAPNTVTGFVLLHPLVLNPSAMILETPNARRRLHES